MRGPRTPVALATVASRPVLAQRFTVATSLPTIAAASEVVTRSRGMGRTIRAMRNVAQEGE